MNIHQLDPFDDRFAAGVHEYERSILSFQKVLSKAFGAGYVLRYSEDISALVGVQVMFIRDSKISSIVERQFLICVSVIFNPYAKSGK